MTVIFTAVLRIRIRFILIRRIRIWVAKNQPKSWKISTKIIRISFIFFKTIKLIFPILARIWSRIRIRNRIRYFTKRIRGSGSISKWNGSATLLHRQSGESRYGSGDLLIFQYYTAYHLIVFNQINILGYE